MIEQEDMMTKKPKCQLIGTDGNVFALLATASRALKAAGQRDEAKQMQARVFASSSYSAALGIIMQYVDAS
jgi:hypothetical protein